MTFLEIIVIIFSVSFVSFILGRYVYKRIKGLPTGECASCKIRNAGAGLKEYYEEHKGQCHCSK